MPVTWRIRDRATFEALRRSGARARRGPVTVSYAPVGSAPRARVAYAVGRQTGKAVTRNRLRRRLRAAVDQVPGLAPGAYLVAAGQGAVGMGFEELKEQVARAMTSASGRAG